MAKNNQTNVDALSRYLKIGFIGFCTVVIAVIAFAIFYMINSNKYVASVYDVKAKKTVARVSKEEFSYLFNNVKQNVYQSYGSNIDFTTYAESVRVTALEAAKDLEVQLIKAEQKGIKMDENDRKKVKELMDNYKAAFGDSNKKEIEDATKQTLGISLNDLEKMYTKLTLVNKLKDKETADKAAWEKEVRAFYDKAPNAFNSSEYRKSGEEAVWVRHILIKTVDEENKELPVEEVKKAEQKAKDLLAKARAGEDFVKLVAENSEDFGSAATGGDYIFAKGAGMDPAFEKAAFELKEGGISDLVKSSFGYHIIKLEEKIPQGKPVSYKAAKEYREYNVEDMAYQSKVDEWSQNYDIRKNNQVYNEFK